MNQRRLDERRVSGVVMLGLLVSGCAQTPLGPTVQVMPGPGKSFDQFTYDQAGCKQFAEGAVAGQAQNANTRGVGAAAITTVLGAGLWGSHWRRPRRRDRRGERRTGRRRDRRGTSSNEQGGIQAQYDNAFAQCMYAKGNMVPGYGPMMVNAPTSAPPPSGNLTYAVQTQLNRLGYLRSPPDCVSGPQPATRSASSRACQVCRSMACRRRNFWRGCRRSLRPAALSSFGSNWPIYRCMMRCSAGATGACRRTSEPSFY